MFRFCQTSPKSGLLCGPSSFKVPERDALAVPVAGLAEDGGGVLVGGDRLVGPARVPQGEAEVVQRPALAVPVAQAPGGARADACGRGAYTTKTQLRSDRSHRATSRRGDSNSGARRSRRQLHAAARPPRAATDSSSSFAALLPVPW